MDTTAMEDTITEDTTEDTTDTMVATTEDTTEDTTVDTATVMATVTVITAKSVVDIFIIFINKLLITVHVGLCHSHV